MRRILGVALICLGLVGAFALGLSCYTVPEPDCGFVCGAGSACPDDYMCGSDTICHRIGAATGTVCSRDGGPMDAPITSPTVVANVPADGATGVSRTAPITATFDQAIEDGTLGSASFIVMTSVGVQLMGTLAIDDATMTASFTPVSELPAGMTLTVQLTSSILSSQNAPLIPFTFSFTTIDDQPPTLVSSMPLDMSTNVPDASVIVVTFSEPVMGVDTTSFVVTSGAAITGTVTGSAATYTFTPTAALPAASLVTVTLGSAISDLAGNPLGPVSFSFTTQ
jgi:hypothetical protein